MSLSEKASQRENGELRVSAPRGVDIEVVDGRFRAVATGSRSIERSLPEGLYSIRWTAAGRAEERLVRLMPRKTLEVAGGVFPLGGAPPSSVGGSNALEQTQFKAVERFAVTDKADDSPEIVVFIRSPNKRVRADVSRSLRLIDANNETVRSGKLSSIVSADESSMLSDGWAARGYRVPAGTYRLRYMSERKRVMEQIIYAMPGRKTVAFLKYGARAITVKSKAGAKIKIYRGITPDQSTFLSVPIDDDLRDLQEHIQIADILLHKIVSGEPLNDRELASDLTTPGRDPFLQIYAAALLLGPRDGLFEQTERPGQPDRVWELGAAAALVDALAVCSNLPDVICLSWRLAAKGGAGGARGNAVISTPPMLECCWRWSSAYSAGDFRNEMLGAAARTPLVHAPWLAWDVADLRAKTAIQAHTESETRVKQLADLVWKFRHTVAETVSADIGARLSALVNGLSATTIEVANASVAATHSLGPAAAPEQLAKEVAFSTGTPSSYLNSQFDQAFIEFDRLEHLDG